MPLAITRDRVTQIRWGIADFEHRFGRKPEGMWLSETAVDNETLDLLAQNGVLFTILAPHQCARVRERQETAAQPVLDRLGGAGVPWTETPDASVHPNHPYLVRLKEGRSITVFFYNGPVSRAIAFEGVLNNGETFAWRLARGMDPSMPERRSCMWPRMARATGTIIVMERWPSHTRCASSKIRNWRR